jgi:isopenicillin N synthase-like dioxygenase
VIAVIVVPVIDLQGFSLLPSDHLRKDQYDTISTQISSAAENWGFFQIINHGIPDSLIARVQAAGKAFFQLPIEEKEAYANEAQNPIGYGSKVGYSLDGEVKLEWGDYYYNIMWPPARRDMSKWPKQLSDFTYPLLLYVFVLLYVYIVFDSRLKVYPKNDFFFFQIFISNLVKNCWICRFE